MTDSLYSATECEAEIKALDADIRELRQLAARQAIGPIQLDYSGRIKDLQNERQVWQNRLKRAKRKATAEESGAGRVGVNGPKSTI